MWQWATGKVRLADLATRTLALACALACACFSGGDAAGTEGAPCRGDGTCDEGLVCLSDLCVVWPDASPRPDAANLPDALPLFDAPPAADACVPLDASPSTPDAGGPLSGLVAHWKLDGFDCDVALDSSGNGNHAAVHGPVPAPDRFGTANAAYAFDGIYDHMEVPHSNVFDFGTGALTMSGWISTTVTTAGGSLRDDILAKGDPTISGFAFSAEQNRASTYFGACGGPLLGDASLNDGAWHHIVATRNNAGNVVLYLDGVAESTDTNILDVTTANSLLIGKHGTKNESYFEGVADDLRVYDRVLSQAEVNALYHEGGWGE